MDIVVNQVVVGGSFNQPGFPVHQSDPGQAEVAFSHHDPTTLPKKLIPLRIAHDGLVDLTHYPVEATSADGQIFCQLAVGDFFL